MKHFTLYWRDGRRQIIQGPTIDQAFTAAGYSAGAVSGIDWYTEGITYTDTYNKETRSWELLETPYKDFTVYWPNGNRENLAGIDIKHALNRAGYEEHNLIVMPVWEEGITDNYLYFPMTQEWISREEVSKKYPENLKTERTEGGINFLEHPKLTNELSDKTKVTPVSHLIFTLYYRELANNYRVLVNGKVHPLLCGLTTVEQARAKTQEVFGDAFFRFDNEPRNLYIGPQILIDKADVLEAIERMKKAVLAIPASEMVTFDLHASMRLK